MAQGPSSSEEREPLAERAWYERMWEPNSRANTAWHYMITGEDPSLRKGRKLRKMLPGRQRCKNCSAPFDGIGGRLMRLMGRGQYPRNPLFCNF